MMVWFLQSNKPVPKHPYSLIEKAKFEVIQLFKSSVKIHIFFHLSKIIAYVFSGM